MKHGVEWRVKPREQLAEETGLSDWQVGSSLEKLKARNLIETTPHKWMGQNYARMLHATSGGL